MVTYQNRITAFVDILGFKQIIKQSENNSSKFDEIQSVVKYLKSWDNNGKNEWGLEFVAVEEDAQKKGMAKFEIADQTACTCFSDSIVVSVLCEDELINEKVSTLISNLAFIGGRLIKAGVLIRGGITIGKLVHTNEGIIMGLAQIEAYELESNCAKNARIIISDKLLALLNYPITMKRDRFPYHQYLKRFEDGCVGFHQLQYFQVMQNIDDSQNSFDKDLSIVRKNIIKGLDFSFTQPEVFLKYKWLADQYNELIICKNYKKQEIHNVDTVEKGKNIHFMHADEVINSET